MKKRILAAMLVFALCFAAAGCKEGGETSSESGEKLTYWVALPSQLTGSGITFNDLPMYKEYNKRTGIEVEFIHPPVGQEAEKFNLMIASGNLPDIVEYDWSKYSGGLTKAVDDGVIIPLDDFIEDSAPNLYKIVSEHPDYKKAATTKDGKYYGFPKMNLTGDVTATSGGLFLRKDWLDKVGMDVPTNVAEWTEVLRAFKNELGVKNPLSLYATQLKGDTGNFNSEFEVGLEYFVKNGKVAYGPMESGYKDMIATFASWYEEGLLDREFAVTTKDTILSQVQTGETGAFWGYIGNGAGGILAAMEKTNPEFELVGAPYPKKDQSTTESYIGRVNVVAAPYACITKNCDDPQKAAKWIDYCYGREGSLLYNRGIEGETYTMVDGIPTDTDLIINNPDGLDAFAARARYHRGYSSDISARFAYGTPEQQAEIKLNGLKASYPFQCQIDAYYTFNKNSENRSKTLLPALEYSGDVVDEVANIKFEVDTYKDENIVRFITGDRPMSEWNDFVKELKELRVEELLKYMQESYDEYSNK